MNRLSLVHFLVSCSKVTILSICFVAGYGAVWGGNPPRGEPNEVWVSVSSGDTVCVGEEFEFQIHLANSGYVNLVVMEFGIESPDSATWQWVKKPDGYGSSPFDSVSGYLTVIPGTRWSGNFDMLGVALRASPDPGGPGMDAVVIEALDFSNMMAPGPLQHMLSMHLKATHAGMMCIDTTFVPPALAPWQFQPENIIPAWNGPFCITVIERPLGDVNCDGVANIGDAVYLINWIFRGGSDPCR